MKPIRRTYNAGAIIYFEGDSGKEIYVLQEGRISLQSTSLDGKSDSTENVKRGEFFGVKSSLGRYPREETAHVIQDSIVLVFSPESFEHFALTNTRLILQMLRVFSSNLRKIHHKVRSLLGEKEEGDTSNDLLAVAEHYHKKNNFAYAAHAYRSYLKNYPSSLLQERATRMLALAEAQKMFPSHIPSIVEDLENQTDSSFTSLEGNSLSTNDLNFSADFVLDEESSLTELAESKQNNEANQPQGASVLYFSAMNALSSKDYATAESQLQQILQLQSIPLAEESYVQKAYYDLARVLAKQKKWKQAIEAYSFFIRKYPHAEMLRKAMNEMAAVYETNNNIAKALAFYQRVSKMTPEDKYSIAAMNKIKELNK